ncbi:FxSxx-COOH system tetratricopeptide repeat protein [Streptomyces griseosporeus]|uniref:FxSxx-COOH system tetratricopeptide repeat protein n=1 Tax=Streptomyces griseosporeus TaxID=1910 RepID=UPI0037AF1918
MHGLGGVGKTQLAVEYAYVYRSKYRFVAFVDAEDPDLVPSQFAALARELGLAEVNSEQVVPRVYGALRDHRPWLIIFDNGERPGTLLDALPSGDLGSGGHLIVTTRLCGWSGTAGVVDLDVFSRQEAVELLTRRVSGMTAAVADRIAEHLGDLPLALEQAAGYMDYHHTAPAEYLALLASRLEDMIALGELTDRPAVVVATLWQLSVRKLQSRRPQAMRLLELCALLAPEPIPLDLFGDGKEPLIAAAADPVVWDTTVGALAGLGLARRGAASLVLHRLVQAAIRAAMPDDVRTDARTRLCRALLAAVPHDIHGDPQAPSRWQELLPHVLAVTKDEPSAGCAAQTATLLRLASAFLLSIGEHSVALPLCERALTIDESLGERDAEIGFDLITLAQIHRDRGAPERARPLAERALGLHESCLPADSPAIATDLATLARIRHLLGDHEAAVPLAERAHADRRGGVRAGRPVRELRPDSPGQCPPRPGRPRRGRAADLPGVTDPRGQLRAGAPVHRVRPAAEGPGRARAGRPDRGGPRAQGRTDPEHPAGHVPPQDGGRPRSGQALAGRRQLPRTRGTLRSRPGSRHGGRRTGHGLASVTGAGGGYVSRRGR